MEFGYKPRSDNVDGVILDHDVEVGNPADAPNRPRPSNGSPPAPGRTPGAVRAADPPTAASHHRIDPADPQVPKPHNNFRGHRTRHRRATPKPAHKIGSVLDWAATRRGTSDRGRLAPVGSRGGAALPAAGRGLDTVRAARVAHVAGCVAGPAAADPDAAVHHRRRGATRTAVVGTVRRDPGGVPRLVARRRRTLGPTGRRQRRGCGGTCPSWWTPTQSSSA